MALFGTRYPETCPDGGGPVGTDQLAFWNAVRARIPSLEGRPWLHAIDQPLPIHDVMDMIEFCYASIGKPVNSELDVAVEQRRAMVRRWISEVPSGIRIVRAQR